MKRKTTMRLKDILFIFILTVTGTVFAWSAEPAAAKQTVSTEAAFNISQTLSEQAQRTTIAFDGMAFITGDLCSDSFIPPGKVADFFGFQFCRDNDPDEMGHNTDYLTKIANNILYILTDAQVNQLIVLAETQATQNNEYAYKRFPLMKAFRRLIEGDLPDGSTGLSKEAVMAYSAELYRLDGQISYDRAQVLGGIIGALNATQREYIDTLASQGMKSWPDVGDQLDKQLYSHDVHVLVMTYASQFFSWYSGSTEGDVYFCPERQGTYFGSFYLKDMPAMGNPDYTINPNLTADMGNAFLDALSTEQAKLITDLVDIQWDDLNSIVTVREQISDQLRLFMTQSSVDEATVLALAETYGELDGAIVYNFATNFAQVNGMLSAAKKAELMVLRDLDDYPCSGAYLYSDNIAMPDIMNTDFLFGVDNGGGGGGGTEPTDPTATISLSRGSLSFGAAGNYSTPAQTFLISNSGTGTLEWTIATDAAWLNVSPLSGSGAAVVTVTVDGSGLSAGAYSGTITVNSATATNSGQTVNVTLKYYNGGTTIAPFGEFATPVNNAGVSSSIPVTGWVLDDIGVESVKIYSGESYVGDAVFVADARPDVQAAYPDHPQGYRAGWGYMLLTNFLPNGGNGTYTLYAKATDVEGNTTVLGSKTITVNNAGAVKPFGAIDTPTQGGTASGTVYRNFGWALTPMPNRIPENGSTISVYVNGQKLGNPVYNLYRSDIASLFPGYANSNGAMAYFDIDTTGYANGVHSIHWVATDSAGNTDGIGSRYFTVQNLGGADEQSNGDNMTEMNVSAETVMNLQVADDGIGIKRGYNESTPVENCMPDERGIHRVSIVELERLQCRMGGDGSGLTGYMMVNGELKGLPAGSGLDNDSGTFYWQPGPGFYGTYNLVFIETTAQGEMLRRLLRVTIDSAN